MSTVASRLSIEQFRKLYADGVKPHFEFWDGEPRQKAMPTRLHAKLQKLVANVLAELGFFSFTELTLHVDPNWEPIPDVAASLHDFPDPYPVTPVEVVIEILSPQDAFSGVEMKCERYAEYGIEDILVFDPVERKVWPWNKQMTSLIRVKETAVFLNSQAVEIDLTSLWNRLDSER